LDSQLKEFLRQDSAATRLFGTNWRLSQNDCSNFYQGAKLCSATQIVEACNAGGFTPIAASWLGERTGDNEALTVNVASCTDFDGVNNTANAMSGKYCCAEFQKAP